MNDIDQYNYKAALIEDLLAAPFIAAASANSKMAQEQARFLIEEYFIDNGDSYTPKMVSLTIDQKKEEASEPMETITFQLPLVTIIPFNSLCVKDIDIKFDMEIVSLASKDLLENSKENKSQMEMRGNIAPVKNTSKETHSKKQSQISVEIKGGTIPLPIGLTSILKLYSNNILLKP